MQLLESIGSLASTIFPWWFVYAVTIVSVITAVLFVYSVLTQRKQTKTGNNSTSKKKGVRDLTKERKILAKKIVVIFSLLTLGSGYILYICLRLLFYELAKKNDLFTLRADGEYKSKMRGDVCVEYIMKVENHRIDPDGFDVFKGTLESYADHLARARERKLQEDPSFIERKLRLDASGNPVREHGHYLLTDEFKMRIEEANSTTIFEEIFGVVLIGFKPHRIFNYQYRWIEYTQEKSKGGTPSIEVGMYPRDENVDSVFHRYPKYGIKIDKAETGAGSRSQQTSNGTPISKIQIKAGFVFETETTNPQKSLFRTGSVSSAGLWQQALVKEITTQLISWIKSSNWDEINEKDKVEEALLEICKKINGVDQDGFRLQDASISSVNDYGQRVIKISMVGVELEDNALQKAAEKVYVAERGAEEAVAQARGARAKAAAPLLGEADGLDAIAKVPGGVAIKVSENLGKIQVYAPGSKSSSLLYNLGVLGDKPPKNRGGKKKTDGDGPDGSST